MCRRDHPSFPSEITCCFLSVLKTLLMPSEPIRALSGVNVPGFPMAGFQLTLYGRIWATPEDPVIFGRAEVRQEGSHRAFGCWLACSGGLSVALPPGFTTEAIIPCPLGM